MITTTIRVDEVMYETLTKKANEEHRSINKEIIYIIERYLDITTWYHKK